jgi:hypothetical protein
MKSMSQFKTFVSDGIWSFGRSTVDGSAYHDPLAFSHAILGIEMIYDLKYNSNVFIFGW